MAPYPGDFTCESIHLLDLFYLITKHFNAYSLFSARRIDVNDVPANSESTSMKVYVISLILHVYELAHHLGSVHLHTRSQRQQLIPI